MLSGNGLNFVVIIGQLLCWPFHKPPLMITLNQFALKNIKTLEMIGVLMRIFSFTLVSWLGPKSPFMFVWFFNTIDAILLSYCAILRKDRAYIVLNLFWILVGLVGIARAAGLLGD